MGYKLEPMYVPNGEWERLNLGSGSDLRDGFTNLDRAAEGVMTALGRFPDGADYVQWDWEHDRAELGYVLPFKNDTFDYILARDVMEHIPHRVTDLSGEFFHHLVSDMIRITKSGGIWEVISPCRPESLGAAGHTRLIDESTFIPWMEKAIDRTSGDSLTTAKVLVTLRHENTRQWDPRDYLRFGRALVKRVVFRVDKNE